MEIVNVIIADMSQLSRLGLISLLKQLNYRFNIREISDPEKLKNTLLKDHINILIISGSFLKAYPLSLIQSLKDGRKYTARIFINDIPFSFGAMTDFNETIELSDIDKVILRKLDKLINELIKPKQFSDFPEEISSREKEVLRLVALGMTNKEIAEKLFISTHTVISHRKNITAKLGIRTIAGLTVYALINKLITTQEIN